MKVLRSAWPAMIVGASLLAACGGGGSYSGSMMGMGYVANALVTDVNGAGNPYSSSHLDTHLVNSWGIAFNPQGFVWVANAGTSTSTLYDGNGVPQSLVVSIPPGSAGSANPTGIVFNGGTGFAVTQGGNTAPSAFIFVGEAGTISGWAPSVNPTVAVQVIDGGAASKIYKGAALMTSAGRTFLYATDFHNARVDVYDTNFAPVAAAGGFVDASLPAGYAPFGIQAVGSVLYVTFAKQDAQAHDEVDGAGLGVVDAFDASGQFLRRVVGTGGSLNAPWGVALAPANFGAFSNALLVGNFGDGRINAFDPMTGNRLGALAYTNGSAITVDGLWGIAFGNGLDNQPMNTLFFAAGPAGETHGVYGRIDVF